MFKSRLNQIKGKYIKKAAYWAAFTILIIFDLVINYGFKRL